VGIEEAAMNRQRRSRLRNILVNHFNDEEFRDLCFELDDVDYDDLPGEGMLGKARELVLKYERYERLDELVEVGKQLRPDISWPNVLQPQSLGKPYHNLPQPDYIDFVDRDKELERILELLSPRSRAWVVVIDGIGGIGKSALALRVAYRCLSDYKRLSQDERFEAIVWTSAKPSTLTASGTKSCQRTTRNLDDILRIILKTLGYQHDIIETPVEEQIKLVQDILSQERTLLIVDNLETVEDERVYTFLHKQLPHPSKSIVTTRRRTDVSYMRLAEMSPSASMALIAQEYTKKYGEKKVELTQSQANKLSQRTDGIPLAILWSVALMGLRDESMETVLSHLDQTTGGLAHLYFEEIMQHIRGSDAHKLAVALTLFAEDADREALGHATGFGKDESSRDEGLAVSVRLSLVHQQADRFSLLPLTRSYLERESQHMPPQFVQNAFKRMLEYYQQLVTLPKESQIGIPYWDGLFNYAQAASLEREWKNLIHLIHWALDKGYEDVALNKLFLPIVHLLHVTGFADERLELSRTMCQVAQRLDDSAGVWLWIDAIGFILRGRKQRQECIQALEAGRRLARHFKIGDALVLADVFEANLYIKLKDLDSAQEKTESVLELADPRLALEQGTPLNRLVARRTASTIASLRRSRKDYVGAQEWHKIELDLRRSIGEDLTSSLTALASLSRRLGDITAAEDYLSEALSAAVEESSMARINYNRAQVARKMGELQKARGLANLALEQYIHVRRRSGIRACRRLLDRLPPDEMDKDVGDADKAHDEDNERERD
jgi:LuxR family glucitol operon transcriptional activator